MKIPEDLVIEILLKLPVKVLVQLKCVCKSWRSLLNSQFFITKHFKVSNQNPLSDNLLVNFWDRTSKDRMVSIISHESLGVVVETHRILSFNGADDFSTITDILGSCNGIVCVGVLKLKVRSQKLVLWNPAIREAKVVSMPLCQGKPGKNSERFCDNVVGFGFDAKTDDYKVVLVEKFIDHPYYGVEIYSLKSESWRLVTTHVENQSLNIKRSSGVCTNGMQSWIAIRSIYTQLEDEYYNTFAGSSYRLHCKEEIISFEMSEEIIISTPLPSCICSCHKNLNTLAVLRGSLAVINHRVREVYENCYNVWVLGEFGVKDSWSKLISIGRDQLQCEIERPLGFWNNFVVFQARFETEMLVLLDIDTQQRKVLLVSQKYWRLMLQLISFKESLVSIKGVMVNKDPSEVLSVLD